MTNILDYLSWRGDLTFSNSKLNEVDKIIFTRIAYLPFKEIIMEQKETIESLMYKFEKIDISNFIWDDDINLIKALGTSLRFKDLIITDYEEKFDVSLEKQFAAITIWISNQEKYVSFRGTDMSIVGWKEDFNMFFKSNIPSQLEGISYLSRIGKKYWSSKLIVGGHSKGGNIAVYASTFVDNKIKKNILEIVSVDGPGVTADVLNDEKYLLIEDKITSYLPQTSIVGRILDNNNKHIVVKSDAKAFMQHDIYSWEVLGTSFIQIEEVTKESEFAYKFIKDWLEKTAPEDRERFINIIYDILVQSDINSFVDLPKLILTNTKNVLKTYKNISEEDKEQVDKMMAQIKKLMTDIIKTERETQNKIKELQQKEKELERLREKELKIIEKNKEKELKRIEKERIKQEKKENYKNKQKIKIVNKKEDKKDEV